MIAYVYARAKLLTLMAQQDTQAILDDDITVLKNYLCGYACKGAQSTEELAKVA